MNTECNAKVQTTSGFAGGGCGVKGGEGCAGCLPVRQAMGMTSDELKKMASYASLVALFTPALGFGLLLYFVEKTGRFAGLERLSTWPWELWVLLVAGVAATAAGLGDWVWHRWIAGCKIGKKERRCELLALAGGGAPVFFLMAAASAAEKPEKYLVAVIVMLLFTTVLICYDEFVFHARRCKKTETRLHRILVFGNAVAFLAWFHWCFVRIHLS
jgi:hypothetical protein